MLSMKTAVAIVVLPSLLAGMALAAQDRYSLQVPGGLAFADFRGYEDWQSVAVSHNGDKLATILGNPALIEAFRAGHSRQWQAFPRWREIRENPLDREDRMRDQPGEPLVPGALHDVDFMVKDSKKFADSGGWGYAQFDYDTASESFKPGDENSTPPQEHDMAKIYWIAKNGRRSARSTNRSWGAARRLLHGEGQQEIRGQRRMGIRRSSNMTRRPRRSGPARRRTCRRRSTTPNAASPATRSWLTRITCSPPIRSGEAPPLSGLTTQATPASAPLSSVWEEDHGDN